MTLKQWIDSYVKEQVIMPDGIKALTDAYYRDQKAKAELAFNAAFLKLQGVLPTIDEKGVIEYRDGRKGTYALNEDIQDAILPLLQAHGFTLHFETAHSDTVLLVAGVLTHKRGHRRTSSFQAPADMSGGKTVAQGRGSIMSYAHRYCTIDLLNLVTRVADNDGATGFKFNFDPSQLNDHAKATFKRLIESAMDDTLEECWSALDTSERASVGFECLQYVKQLAGYIR
jgi:hypothetical protein